MKIYNIMMPKTLYKALDAVRGKDPARLVLNCLYIGKDRIAACDGAMLLTASRDLLGANEDVPAGPYEIIGKPATSGSMTEAAVKPFDAEYPDISRVIPEKTTEFCTLALRSAKPGRETGQMRTSAALALFTLTGDKYNIYHLDKLRALDEDGLWKAYKPATDTRGQALLLTSDSGQYTAVILPFLGDKI